MPRPPVAPVAYAAVLAVMSAAQLTDIPAFYGALRMYDVPALDARGLAVLGIVGEGAVAVGLVLSLLRPQLRLAAAAGALGAVVAAAWAAIAAQALARGLEVANCGYLGAHAPVALRWWLLPLHVAAVALALYAWRVATRAEARAVVSTS